ncbi:hypothetical protein JTB14_001150 [Gonioctena quinquepunctata]|nr:hypothetical protein JTB14_001150 [Gonioctena quinquepunctata]
MKCFVSGCGNSWRKGNKPDNLSFHKFHKSNYEVWLDCLGGDSDLTWPEHSRIGSNHFEEDCFIRTPFRVTLQPNSLPTNQTPKSRNNFTVTDNQEIMDFTTVAVSSPEK